MWFELFVLAGGGNLWFWLLVAAEVVWLLGAAKAEKGFMGILGIVVFGLAMWLFGDFNIFQYTYQNPLWIIVFLSSYLFIGLFWSVLKWKWFVSACHDRYQESKRQFMSLSKLSGEAIPDDKKAEWLRYLGNHANKILAASCSYLTIQTLEDIIPKAKNNKSRIIFWMSYWPFSLLWSIFHDFIEQTFKMIFERFQKIYENIAASRFQNVKGDF